MISLVLEISKKRIRRLCLDIISKPHRLETVQDGDEHRYFCSPEKAPLASTTVALL